MKTNTKAVGERTEGFILARLLQLGHAVSLPFGDNQRYDMILDDNGKLLRCQCKTGRLKEAEGCVIFKTTSSNWLSGESFHYVGQVDAFLVYCPQNGKCYRIPISKSTRSEQRLRVKPAKNGQTKGTLNAVDFEF